MAEGPGATNNVGEFAAATRALEVVRAMALPPGSRLTVHADANLVVNILGGAWKAKNRAALYFPHYERARDALAALRADGIAVALTWIPREQNERADALSKQAIAPPAPMRHMPFGVHQGVLLSAVPTEYLLWLTRWPPLRDPLQSAVLAELRQRHIAPLRSVQASA